MLTWPKPQLLNGLMVSRTGISVINRVPQKTHAAVLQRFESPISLENLPNITASNCNMSGNSVITVCIYASMYTNYV